MKRLLLTVVALLFLTSTAHAQWSVFKSDRFGVSMLIAPGTRWEARDLGDGWGRVVAKKGVVTFVIVAKLGYQAKPAELERYAVKATEIPFNYWTLVDKGRNASGWIGWRTYETRLGNRLIFAVIGIGQRGSYVVFLETTAGDFARNKPLYNQWYKTLSLY
jgi:hypothetical protein